MTRTAAEFDELTEKFSKHLKVDSLGRMAMRARDQSTREEWAGLDDDVRTGSRLLAMIRITHELEELAAEVQMASSIDRVGN